MHFTININEADTVVMPEFHKSQPVLWTKTRVIYTAHSVFIIFPTLIYKTIPILFIYINMGSIMNDTKVYYLAIFLTSQYRKFRLFKVPKEWFGVVKFFSHPTPEKGKKTKQKKKVRRL